MENQHWAEIRLPQLLAVPAERRFLSCEPLLGPLDLRQWTSDRGKNLYPIDWVIAGGESGPKARAMLPGWARDLRDQCRSAEIPFHFKQWGHWVPAELVEDSEAPIPKLMHFADARSVEMARLPKKLAGRVLEGTTWDGVPSLK